MGEHGNTVDAVREEGEKAASDQIGNAISKRPLAPGAAREGENARCKAHVDAQYGQQLGAPLR